jgi:nucleotide-binding universal stress UspA family protein
MYRHILLPTDGSELSNKAIPQAVSLARATGAQITGLHVSPTFHTFSAVPLLLTDDRRGLAPSSSAARRTRS